MSGDCLFCEMVEGKVSSCKVYEDGEVFAFRDINPQSPIHVVVVPKKHMNGLNNVSHEDERILGHIQVVIAKIARQFPEMDNGFRVINNCGKDGGQTVFHIHYHLLGGRTFGWPPG